MSISSSTSSRSSPSIPDLPTRSRLCSPDGKVLSPDIVKRIIEGHEESDIFEECLESRDYAERADLLAQELSKYMQKGNRHDLEDMLSTAFERDGAAGSKIRGIKLFQPQHPLGSRIAPESALLNKAPADGNAWGKSDSASNNRLEKLAHEGKRRDVDSADVDMKSRLNEAEREIVRLEQNLLDTVADLTNEKRKCQQYERKLFSPGVLNEKQTEFGSRQSLEIEPHLRKLQHANQELRQQSNELQSQLQVSVAPERRRCLANMTQRPVVYKGDVEGDHDKTTESVDTILTFSGLESNAGSCKELQANTSQEWHATEITDKFAAELEKMSKDREKLEAKCNEDKAKIVAEYEERIKQIHKNFAAEKSALVKRLDHGSGNSDPGSFVQKDLQANKAECTQEINKLKAEHKDELERLQKRISSLETENGEMELKFLNQMGDLEQKYRIEVSELEQKLSCQSRELERNQKYVDFLKSDFARKAESEIAEINLRHANEMQDMRNECEIKLKNSIKEHENTINGLQLGFAERFLELESNFKKETAALKDRCEKEKNEVARKMERENVAFREKLKLDYERDVAAQVKELRKAGDEYEKYRQDWEREYMQERQELLQSFEQEKSSMLKTWNEEKISMEEKFCMSKARLEESNQIDRNDFLNRLNKQKESAESALREEIEKLKTKLEGDFTIRLGRETELLESTVEHLEKELSSLKYQKKELETKLQVFELKSISQKQEAEEISEFQSEKKKIAEKMSELQKTVSELNAENEALKMELKSVVKEKATILDNSVREITDKQEEIARLQSEKAVAQERISELLVVKDDAAMAARENLKLAKQIQEMQKELNRLCDVRKENRNLEERIVSLTARQSELEQLVQERTQAVSRLQDEVANLQKTMENMESIHKKESEAQKERLQMTTTTAASEKVRLSREISDLKDNLMRANASSDRESELKYKIFNDAKAEVMNLSKKVEEKTQRVRALDSSLQQVTAKLNQVNQEKDELEKELHEIKSQYSDQNRTASAKAGRTVASADTLVQELYIENADLIRQMHAAEAARKKAEQTAKQLADQKRALQRVISKLCSADRSHN